MRYLRWGALLVLLLTGFTLLVEPASSRGAPEKKPYGIDKRVPWTTSRVIGSPNPPLPYRVTRTFTKLKVPCPIAMAHEPGSDQVQDHLVLAIAHHLAVFTLAGLLIAEIALLRPNLTPERIKKTLIHEQWMRLLRDGKDVGYTYTVEEPDNSAGRDGVKIGIRSR